MQPFVFEALPQRVVFGAGTLAGLPDEVRRLGRSRAFVPTTAAQRAEAEGVALRKALVVDADCLVAVGGGSTAGLSKALALPETRATRPRRHPRPVRADVQRRGAGLSGQPKNTGGNGSMRDANEHTITGAVLEQFAGTPDKRLKALVSSLVCHLHAFVREVAETERGR